MPAKFTFVAVVAIVLGAMTAPPPTAAAAPPGFPDLNAFTPVDPHGYFRSASAAGISQTSIFFSTSDGVLCTWGYIPEGMVLPTANPAITCSGNIPSIPDSVPDNGGVGSAQAHITISGQAVFDRHWGKCPPFAPWVVALNAGQKIETGDATCAVGAEGLIACIQPMQDHGFVVQPSGSWVF